MSLRRYTRYLYRDERYSLSPEQRTPHLKSKFQDKANEFRISDLERVSNVFLSEQKEEPNKLNFVRNIFLKRVHAQSIVYGVRPDGSPSLLFFDRADTRSVSKYYKKTKTWEHENEFRIVVSLSGGKVINLGTDCIKNIYLGCNMANESIMSILDIMSAHSMKTGLYKMVRLKNGGLAPRNIDWRAYATMFAEIDKKLNGLR